MGEEEPLVAQVGEEVGAFHLPDYSGLVVEGEALGQEVVALLPEELSHESYPERGEAARFGMQAQMGGSPGMAMCEEEKHGRATFSAGTRGWRLQMPWARVTGPWVLAVTARPRALQPSGPVGWVPAEEPGPNYSWEVTQKTGTEAARAVGIHARREQVGAGHADRCSAELLTGPCL